MNPGVLFEGWAGDPRERGVEPVRPLMEEPRSNRVDDWQPATTNQPGKEYPKVNSEGRVMFRIVAPDATGVPDQALAAYL